jgi:hypothetical protein
MSASGCVHQWSPPPFTSTHLRLLAAEPSPSASRGLSAPMCACSARPTALLIVVRTSSRLALLLLRLGWEAS